MTSLKTSIKTITYLSDTGCLEIQGASLIPHKDDINVFRLTCSDKEPFYSLNGVVDKDSLILTAIKERANILINDLHLKAPPSGGEAKCDYEKACTEINQTIPASLNRTSGTAKRSLKR